MIEVKNLSKSFDGTVAVDRVSFTVAEGESLVLLGRSGCGKTTLLKMINRLIEPSSGEIIIRGRDARRGSAEELRRSIGYVFQNTGLFPHYTISENIGVVPRLLGWDAQRIRHRTLDLMKKLHLPASYLDSYPSQLSGGQQQRIGLARALAADPPILLMDEAFGALDPITRSSLQKDFTELDELKSKTIILVTHDIAEAFELADRICLMDKGRIVQEGKPDELLSHPASEYVSAFFDDVRFQLEAKMLAAGDHAGIVRVFDDYKRRSH